MLCIYKSSLPCLHIFFAFFSSCAKGNVILTTLSDHEFQLSEHVPCMGSYICEHIGKESNNAFQQSPFPAVTPRPPPRPWPRPQTPSLPSPEERPGPDCMRVHDHTNHRYRVFFVIDSIGDLTCTILLEYNSLTWQFHLFFQRYSQT